MDFELVLRRPTETAPASQELGRSLYTCPRIILCVLRWPTKFPRPFVPLVFLGVLSLSLAARPVKVTQTPVNKTRPAQVSANQSLKVMEAAGNKLSFDVVSVKRPIRIITRPSGARSYLIYPRVATV